MAIRKLPSLRALQTFEAFGRAGSVAATARELNVTSGAVSQQLRLLEVQVGQPLFVRRGRSLALLPEAQVYHRTLVEGFEKLRSADAYIQHTADHAHLSISALPSLFSYWLNPLLGAFQEQHPGVALNLQATNIEPDADLPYRTFRLTYGRFARAFPNQKELFQDQVFPACSLSFAQRYPEVFIPGALRGMPLLYIDCEMGGTPLPNWSDWFALFGLKPPIEASSGRFSHPGLAIQAALDGKGVVLAQASSLDRDIKSGRLVRLSDIEIDLPDYYYACWGTDTPDDPIASDFLIWLLEEALILSQQIRKTPKVSASV